MIVLAVLVIYVVADVPTHDLMNNAAWEQVAERKHDDAGVVQIDRAEVAGVTCFRATAVTEGIGSERMLEVATDAASSTEWSTAGITKAEVLEQENETLTFMQYLDTPGWTLAHDRYWFLVAEIHDGEEEKWLRWDPMDPDGPHKEAYDDFKRENPKAIEPPINVGGWHFIEAEGSVTVEYSICTDAGGAIPQWLQRTTTRRTLPDTVGDLVREAKRRQADDGGKPTDESP